MKEQHQPKQPMAPASGDVGGGGCKVPGSCGVSGRQRKEVFITGPNPELLQLYLGQCSNDCSGDWTE